MSLFKRYYPVLVAVLVAVLPLGMNTYWTEVAVNVGLYALLALSLNVILGQAGIFHMGHAAFYAVGAYVTAILNTHYQIPILLLIPVAGAAAALFALIVARPIIHLRGDYLLIVTIGIVEIVRIALINDVFGLTGGANGIFGIARPELFGIKIRKAIQFYYLIWIMVGLTVLLFHWLSESRFGRALNCIKEDDTAAEGCGMDVAHLKLMAFVIGAFWAGMAGNLFAAKMTIISPSSFTFWESVVVFAVVILSGGSHAAAVGAAGAVGLSLPPAERLARHVPHRGPAGNVPRLRQRPYAGLRPCHDDHDGGAPAGASAAFAAPVRCAAAVAAHA